MSLSPLRAPPHEPHRLQRYVADLARAVGEGLMYLGEAGRLLEEGIRRSAEASGRAADTVARDVTSVVGAVRSVDAEPGFNGIGGRISAAPYSPARVIRRIYENTPTLQNRYRRTSLERRGDLAESLANCAARRLKERQLDAGESFVRSLSSNLLTLYGDVPTREQVMAWVRRERESVANDPNDRSKKVHRWVVDAITDTYLKASEMAATVRSTIRERAAALLPLNEKVRTNPEEFENELGAFVDEFVEEGRPIQLDRLDRWTVNSPIREAILRAALEQTPARADPMPAQETPKTPNEDLHLRTAKEIAPDKLFDKALEKNEGLKPNQLYVFTARGLERFQEVGVGSTATAPGPFYAKVEGDSAAPAVPAKALDPAAAPAKASEYAREPLWQQGVAVITSMETKFPDTGTITAEKVPVKMLAKGDVVTLGDVHVASVPPIVGFTLQGGGVPAGTPLVMEDGQLVPLKVSRDAPGGVPAGHITGLSSAGPLTDEQKKELRREAKTASFSEATAQTGLGHVGQVFSREPNTSSIAPARFTAKDIADFNEEVRRVVEGWAADNKTKTDELRWYLRERGVLGTPSEEYSDSLAALTISELGEFDQAFREMLDRTFPDEAQVPRGAPRDYMIGLGELEQRFGPAVEQRLLELELRMARVQGRPLTGKELKELILHPSPYTAPVGKLMEAEAQAAYYQQRIEAAMREAAVAASTPRPVDSIRMGLSPEEADRIVAKWREAYPKMAEYLDRAVEAMTPDGAAAGSKPSVDTPSGRYTLEERLGAPGGWDPMSALDAGRKALAERPEEVLSLMCREFDEGCTRVFEGSPNSTAENGKEFLERWVSLWFRTIEDCSHPVPAHFARCMGLLCNHAQGLSHTEPDEHGRGARETIADVLKLRNVIRRSMPIALLGGPPYTRRETYRDYLVLLRDVAASMMVDPPPNHLEFLRTLTTLAWCHAQRISENDRRSLPKHATVEGILKTVREAGRVLPLHLDAYYLLTLDDWRKEISGRLEAAQKGAEFPEEAVTFVRAGRFLAEAGEEADEDRRTRWAAFEEAVEEVIVREEDEPNPAHVKLLLEIYKGFAGPVSTEANWDEFLFGLRMWAEAAPLSLTNHAEHFLNAAEIMGAPKEHRAFIRGVIMQAAGESEEEIQKAMAQELAPRRSLGQKLTETAAEDASEIALRVAVQRVRGELAERVAAWSARRLAAGDETVRAEQVTFFTSPAGQGLITYMLGMGWRMAQGHAEWIPAGPLSERVAREIRLQGGEDLVAGFYREVVAPLISRVQGGAAGFLEEPRTGVRIAQGVSDPRATELARLRTEVAELEAATPGAGARGSRP